MTLAPVTEVHTHLNHKHTTTTTDQIGYAMSRTSKLVVTLQKWEVTGRIVDDSHGGSDWEVLDEYPSEYAYARRDYERGPEGKAELIADLIAAFKSEGVEFSATGNDWAALPDGAYPLYHSAIYDVANDYVCREITMNFADGTPSWVIRDVINGVG